MTNNPKYLNNDPVNIYPISHSASIKIFESKSDLDIWKAFNRGDEFAFNYIYRVYVTELFKYGCQITKDQSLIQDCIQNIFIDLRRKRGDLSEVQSIKAYLFKILYRELIRKSNKIKESTHLDYERVREQFIIEFSHESKIIQLENQEEKSHQIKVALNKLTCRQRQAILLLYEEGMTYKEISIAMDLNEVKSARKVIYRALATLKSLLIKK